MLTTINEFKNYNTLKDVEYNNKLQLDGSNAYIYNFNSDKYEYQLIFGNVPYSKYQSFAFKAKTSDEYFYEFDKITNDSLYKILHKIGLIINKHKDDFNLTGLIYSVTKNKKGRQRDLLYKRICSLNNWTTQDVEDKVEIIF